MNRFFASPADPWFRIGRLEVGSIMAVVVATVASWVAWMIYPPLPNWLALSPEALAAGHVWRLFTWPLASGPGLWTVITLFLFYYFGSDLERMIGAKKMAWYLVGIWGSLTAVSLLVSLATGGGLAGLRPIELIILLTWILEYPTRRFLFNIPAWVFGAILVGLEVVSMVAARSLSGLLSLVLSFALVAVIARRVGLLSELNWIPGRPAAGRPAAGRPRKPRPTKASRAQARQQQRQASSQERIDALLDKISAEGLHSLTNAERRELEKWREARRRG